jgi:hypothetical protein
LQGSGEGHQLGGVAGEPLDLVDGDDDVLAGGGLLDVAGQLQCGFELGADLDAGADLLREDPPAPGCFERCDLATWFLPGGGAARVSFA